MKNLGTDSQKAIEWYLEVFSRHKIILKLLLKY